ncbi:MAG: hypothetical protein H0X38_10915 [Planctomycetes bacterium]|nr:hypothetical protein [Planctomycetota bacterium]
MTTHLRLQRAAFAGGCAILLLAVLAVGAPAADAPVTAGPVTTGQRVFTCGHSFHAFWINPILADMAQSAGITGHETVGISKIGGSRVIQHWNVADDKNEAKAALRAGKVDVLTLSPMHLADDGIDKFAELALQGNPQIRVTIQEFWMPWDKNEWPFTGDPAKVDNNAMTVAGLKALHDPYFAAMDAYVRGINERVGHQELFVVPVGQAVNALRGLIIAGKVSGIDKQSDLFTDKLGHPHAPLTALGAYCHFAVIYRRTPIGLPLPAVLANEHRPLWDAALNKLLQELAWDAVIHHPLSGVTGP